MNYGIIIPIHSKRILKGTNMNLSPFYADRAPSKEIQNKFKANGGIESYKAWKQRMIALSESVVAVLGELQQTRKDVSYTLAKTLAGTPQDIREKLLEGLKIAFAYTATLTDFVDGRNQDAFTFMATVTASDYTPQINLQDALNHVAVLGGTDMNTQVQNELNSLLSLISADYTAQEIAEVWVAEYHRSHRTHQQSITRNIHDAFYRMHDMFDQDSDDFTGWALKSGRSNCAFPYI